MAETPNQDDKAFAQHTIASFPLVNAPNEWSSGQRLFWVLLFSVFVGLLPLVLPLGAARVFPTPDLAIETPRPLTAAKTEIELQKDRLLDSLIAPGPRGEVATPGSIEAHTAAAAFLAALTETARNAEAKKRKRALAVQRAQWLLVGGLVLFGSVMLAALIYQMRLAKRIWLPAFKNAVRGPVGAMGLVFYEMPVALAVLTVSLLASFYFLTTANGLFFLAPLVALSFAFLLVAIPATRSSSHFKTHFGLFAGFPLIPSGLIAVCASPAIVLAVQRVSGPVPLASETPFAAPEVALPVAAVVTMLCALTAVTCFAARTLSRNFPALWRAGQFVEAGSAFPRHVVTRAPLIWTAILELPKIDPERAFPPVHPTLTAAQAMAILNALVRVLAVVMVLALVTLSLANEVMLKASTAPEALAEDLVASTQAWLILIGVGFSVTLGLIYLGPAVRLDVYVDAYAEAKEILDKADKKPAAKKSWSAEASLTEDDVLQVDWREGPRETPEPSKPDRKAKSEPQQKQQQHSALHPATGVGITDRFAYRLLSSTAVDAVPITDGDDRDDLERDWVRRLGANRLRFTAILAVIGYGGAFHAILEKKLKLRIREIATLFAPAAASTILSFLQ